MKAKSWIIVFLLLVGSTSGSARSGTLSDKPAFLSVAYSAARDSVGVGWIGSPESSRYAVLRRKSTEEAWNVIQEVDTSFASVYPEPGKQYRYDDTQLSHGVTYLYVVHAFVGSDERPYSSEAQIHVPLLNDPDLTGPRVSGASAKMIQDCKYECRVEVSWFTPWPSRNRQPDPIAVNIFRRTIASPGHVSEDPSYSMVASQAADTSSYMDGAVQNGKTYEYVLTFVFSNFNESRYSKGVVIQCPW